ncbi:hypothetical protein SAY86_006312 [Trapa natans]|uniref:Amino acid transporter transmembrane domain-containing protein n=1 Tax=Trapa natans TaxID=22666 RepID=A0AAN7L731_TRANT|nr:hypothetical protein SAY86_006312 [Trapa natans]
METHEHNLNVPLLADKVQQWASQQPIGFAQKVEEVEFLSSKPASTASMLSQLEGCVSSHNLIHFSFFYAGVGILSTPYALASGGWLSLTLLFAIAIAAFYSGILIQRCMDLDPSIRTYPDIGERAFGKKGRLLISVFMYVELFLVATGFLILEGDNLHNIFPSMQFEIGSFLSRKQSLVVIVGLFVLPTVWVDSLSILSYVSASGVLASGIILISIFWTGAFDGVGFQQKGRPVNWSGIPTAVSLYSFCYCAHPVFPTIYTSMKKNHQFSCVLVVCFILCTISYAAMAVMGYLMFGDAVESQVTLNLPIEKLSSKIAIYTTLLNPICKYALMVTPIVNTAKQLFPCRSHTMRPLGILVGTTLVLSNVFVAICVPFFGYLMALVGSFLSVTASIILPCLCYLKISGSYRSISYKSVMIWVIILFGVAEAVFGTYTALGQILAHL